MGADAKLPTMAQLAATARSLANDLFSGVDCSEMKHGKPSCIQAEEDRPLTREEKAKDWHKRPFFGYDASRMCDGCAVYWWAEMAAQTLHRMEYWQDRINAEEARKTST